MLDFPPLDAAALPLLVPDMPQFARMARLTLSRTRTLYNHPTPEFLALAWFLSVYGKRAMELDANNERRALLVLIATLEDQLRDVHNRLIAALAAHFDQAANDPARTIYPNRHPFAPRAPMLRG